MKIGPNPEYLPARQVAEVLQKNVSTIYRWCNAGHIREIRVGGRRHIQIKSLVNYLGEETAKVFGLL